MASFDRGKVVRATFEIEYPDGSRKVAELDEPQAVSHIVFDPAEVREGDEALINVSEADWKENPAMVIYLQSNGGIPFCTHNRCS